MGRTKQDNSLQEFREAKWDTNQEPEVFPKKKAGCLLVMTRSSTNTSNQVVHTHDTTYEEISRSITKLKNNEAPGSDSIAKECLHVNSRHLVRKNNARRGYSTNSQKIKQKAFCNILSKGNNASKYNIESPCKHPTRKKQNIYRIHIHCSFRSYCY